MKLLDKFKKKPEIEVEIVKKETVLYILLETPKGGIVNYLQGNGIMVRSVDTDIDSTLMKVISETRDLRLIIIDYGVGIFNDRQTRSDIIELVETSSSDGKHVTIFTNNGGIGKEITSREIDAQVRNYKGASDIVKELNKYHEVYTVGGATDIEIENQIEFKGEKVDTLDKLGLFIKPVDLHILNVEGNGIQGFNVKY